MPKAKKYLDIDVYIAAKQRIHHVFDIFDTVVVMFSGGKDSLVTLNLVKEVSNERGIPKVKVCFRDEELIPANVIEIVEKYQKMDWVDMLYLCVPLASTKYILGKTVEYVQWDLNRRHIRPMPVNAYKLPVGDKRVFDQHTMDAFTATFYKGKIAFCTGLRAAESIMRFRACVVKLNENYITAGCENAPNVKLVKPIFDWSEDDVFKYLYENKIEYARIYDEQIMAGVRLRVSTPLHSEAAKRFDKLRSVDPVFYAQVVDVFPEMLTHERYYKDIDFSKAVDKYGQTLDGVKQWIIENYSDDSAILHKALLRFNSVLPRAKRMPDRYSPKYLLKFFMAGTFKREILPDVKKTREKYAV